jgi:hypothetical protein
MQTLLTKTAVIGCRLPGNLAIHLSRKCLQAIGVWSKPRNFTFVYSYWLSLLANSRDWCRVRVKKPMRMRFQTHFGLSKAAQNVTSAGTHFHWQISALIKILIDNRVWVPTLTCEPQCTVDNSKVWSLLGSGSQAKHWAIRPRNLGITTSEIIAQRPRKRTCDHLSRFPRPWVKP